MPVFKLWSSNRVGRFSVVAPNCVELTVKGTPQSAEILQAIRASPLPAFCGLARQLLNEKRPEDDWPVVVGQAADYYFSRWPGINNPSHYKEIGMEMYQVYPCIGQANGIHPHRWGPLAALTTLHYLENATKFTSKKKSATSEQFESLFTLYENADTEGVLKELTEADRTPLHVVAFLYVDNGRQELIYQYLAGYGVVIEMPLRVASCQPC